MTKRRKDNVRQDVAVVTTELREKVHSKMDVGKFFAGFITLLIGILLNDCSINSLLPQLGVVFLISSLGFCVAAVFCYDRLLMPREYWTSLSKEQKTEENFQDQLKEEMVRSWSWLFVPAIFCFAIGFLLVLADPLGLRLDAKYTLEPMLLVAILLVGVLIPLWLGKLKGPKIYD